MCYTLSFSLWCCSRESSTVSYDYSPTYDGLALLVCSPSEGPCVVPAIFYLYLGRIPLLYHKCVEDISMQQLWPLHLIYTLMGHLRASPRGSFVHWDKSVRCADSLLFRVHYIYHHVGRRKSFQWRGKFRHGVLCGPPDSRTCIGEHRECPVFDR